MNATARAIIALTPMLLLVGCGGPYDSEVSGRVTFNGEALPRGTVAFSPQTAGPQAFGVIGSDGAYTLRTGREEGLASGAYNVSVTASEVAAYTAGSGPPPMGKSITPAWYADPTSSGLTYTIEPGDNEINIELSSTPPAGWKPPAKR